MPRQPSRLSARTRAAAVVAIACLGLAGCAASPDAPDPALVSSVQDALSAARSAEIGLQVAADGRSFATTTSVLLADMGEALADAARELELQTTDDPVDAAFRKDALSATRQASEAVHTAQQGHPRVGARELSDAADELERLAGQG